MINPIDFEQQKMIDSLFKKHIKDERCIWDYYSINESDITIFYHYWTYSDKGFPLYNKKSIKIPMEEWRYNSLKMNKGGDKTPLKI